MKYEEGAKGEEKGACKEDKEREHRLTEGMDVDGSDGHQHKGAEDCVTPCHGLRQSLFWRP